MKSTELRIGNYLNNPHWDSPKKVTEIRRSENYPKDASHHITDDVRCEGTYLAPIGGFLPVQLTEEWLEKLGFKKTNDNWTIKVGDNDDWLGYCSVYSYEDKWIYSNDISNAGCYTLRSIEFVHQLQNLHFFLNSIEL